MLEVHIQLPISKITEYLGFTLNDSGGWEGKNKNKTGKILIIVEAG